MSHITTNLPIKNESAMSLQKDINEFFERMLRDPVSVNSMGREIFSPCLEVKEDEKSYRVTAELPGMAGEDIHLSLKDNSLILEGEKKSETVDEENSFLKSEISYGQFYREIPFNVEIDLEKITASYKDGILTVELAKSQSQASKIRKITVKKN